jgi:predicted nucleic acid-binding protein
VGIVENIGAKRIYLDANIFIYALEGFPEFKNVLTELFSAIDDHKIQAVTSDLTLAEVLVKPLKDGNLTLIETYKKAIESGAGLSVAPVNRAVLIEAATLRSQTKLKLPDGIHVATALQTGCSIFLTNDERISIKGLEILVLGDLLKAPTITIMISGSLD